jgi:hypothetical protein
LNIRRIEEDAFNQEEILAPLQIAKRKPNSIRGIAQALGFNSPNVD